MPAYDVLVIDPQNDFLDIAGAALPVPGANADMDRLATWLQTHAMDVRTLTVTLDSHASVGVERTTFWQQADGSAVAPFTVVTHADVAAGTYLPRHAQHRDEALAYLKALEAAGQRQLVVWPVHCVVGTWGHNIHAGLANAMAHWEALTGRLCHKVLKGQHPLTEQYSAFKAEVPRADDPRTLLNQPLVDALSTPGASLLIAGEALSHCATRLRCKAHSSPMPCTKARPIASRGSTLRRREGELRRIRLQSGPGVPASCHRTARPVGVAGPAIGES